MKIVIPNLTIKLASVALIFTYSSIHAQEDIADSGQEVEEITVTAVSYTHLTLPTKA